MKGCGKPLSNPFFIHHKCGEEDFYGRRTYCNECYGVTTTSNTGGTTNG